MADTSLREAPSFDAQDGHALADHTGVTWEYATEFDAPHMCLLTDQTPRQAEPRPQASRQIWPRIRMGYQLEKHFDHPRTTRELKRFSKHPMHLRGLSKQAERYIFYIVDSLQQRGMPLELALLPIVESAYDPFAYSHGQAAGMWQFIPSTARAYKMEMNWWYDGRRDVIASTQGALDYLQKLNRYYDGDWLLTLAAYNAGQGNVNKALRKNKRQGKPRDYFSLDLPRETRSYVPKLLALAKLFASPHDYRVRLHPVANRPYFHPVDTQGQLDLAEAAKMAELPIEELYLLNPGYNKWATAPDGPHRLLLPTAHVASFEQNLQQLPPEKRLTWQRYTIKSGDSLSVIAAKFHTTVKTIKQVNALGGTSIRAGKSLLIPVASRDKPYYSLSADQRLANLQSRPGGKHRAPLTHTVKSGESLWTIAKQHGVSIAKLSRWNGIAPKDWLRPGQKLRLWKQTRGAKRPGDYTIKKVGYRVRRGDSLARIAGRFNVRVSDIMKWNQVNPEKYLQPGQQLTLYIDIMNNMN